MLPTGFIQDLLARVDIVELVGRQVELRRAGINHKGLCPFHGEKTPSFIVSSSRQTYHCFGCGAHGDAIRFLTEQSGLHFMDAVRELSQQVGLRVPEDESSPEQRAQAAQERERYTTLGGLLAQAEAHYRQQLKASPRAIDYLKGRGLSGEVAARFGMGYAAEGWRALASVFARYDDPLLVEAGLVIVQGEDEAEAKRYDRFRERIMFPIRSVRGEVIGFGGRVLDNGEPKYLNSPETPLFHKGQELYGLYEARQALRQAGYALVVEGYMDVVALAQSGFAHAVATLGTACTAEHVAKLLRFTDAVVFSFDGDAAGRRAAGRALEAALPHASDTRSIRFLFLPPEHDPDSFVRERGAEAFQAAIDQAVPLSAQMLVQCAEGCDLASAEGRVRMLAQAKPLVEQLPDGLLRQQLMSELAQRGGVDLSVLLAHWTRRAARPAAATGIATFPRRVAVGRVPPQTATLLDRCAWLLARHPQVWQALAEDDHHLLAAQPFPYGAYFMALERVLNDHGPLALPALMGELQGDADAQAMAPVLQRIGALHDVPDDSAPQPVVELVLLRLRLDAVNEHCKLLTESAPHATEDMQRYRELTEQQRRLRAQLALASAAAAKV